MRTVTLGKLNTYEQGHCDRDDNDDLIIKKYLLEDTYSSFIPYYTSDTMEELNKLIDERFVFNGEEDSLFYEDNVFDLPMYLSQSLLIVNLILRKILMLLYIRLLKRVLHLLLI